MLVLEASDAWSSPKPPQSVYVYVEDVDATYARAMAMGAASISEPNLKPYKERACGVRDRFGNTWYIATYTG
jgi:PhnB protein